MKGKEEGPAAVVRAYLAALNRGDADAAAQYVDVGFVNEHTSALGETLVGRDAYRKQLGNFLATFHALRYEIEEMIVEGNNVAVAYRMSASWCPPGAAPQRRRPFLIRGMFRFRVEAGRIARRVDYWDSGDFQRQVGERRSAPDSKA